MKRTPEAERMDRQAAADAYAAADFAEVNRKFVADAAARIGTRPAQRILDLGCGPGDIPVALASSVAGGRIVAVDAAAEMLQWARTRVNTTNRSNHVALVRGDAKQLPFPDAAFDAVISNSILHHVADPVAFWLETKRVAKRGACIFTRDLKRPKTIQSAQRLVDDHAAEESEELRGEFFRSLCAAYTIEEVRRQLEKAGLNNVEVRNVSDRHLDVLGTLS